MYLKKIINSAIALTEEVKNMENSNRFTYKFNALPINQNINYKKGKGEQKMISEEEKCADDFYKQKIEGLHLTNAMTLCFHPLY